jgi:hypothetical protein
VRSIPAENASGRSNHAGRTTGTGRQSTSGNISITDFLERISEMGYELVGATSQERSKGGASSKHFGLRYAFARKDYVEKIVDDFKKVRREILSNLKEACIGTIWLGKVFINPFYRKSQEVSGVNSISINLSLHPEKQKGEYKKVKNLHATNMDEELKEVLVSNPVIADKAMEEMHEKCSSQ